MVYKEYRYHLATSAEMRSLGYPRGKANCPQCNRLRYKFWLDRLGHIIAYECGDCDRDNNCNYSLSPKEYLKLNPEDIDSFDAAKYIKAMPKKKQIEIPIYMVSAKQNKDNNLLTWLRSLPWPELQRKWLEDFIELYKVGTGNNGEVIWWQIDENAKVRSGKLMNYLKNGHRDKTGNFGSWVHTALIKAGMIDGNQYEYKGCLFGQHLMSLFPNATINIVESEKTALIMSAFTEDPTKIIWMATGGLNNIQPERLLPLFRRNKKIYFYPDHDGYEKWKEKLSLIDYKYMIVSDAVINLYNKEEDSDNADIADIMIRRMLSDNKIQTTADKVVEILGREDKRGIITTLCEKLNLSIADEQRS